MDSIQRLLKHTDILLGIGMLLVVGMLIFPLPHWALDLGLVIAIASSVVIVLTAINVKDPLEFSVFPSLLLITTLFRLALSIAATKLILGTSDGGRVIETFGEFVLGGDFVVGFVAFLILMIVQFIVITNGATRVSEVVARFTLDAMPGKQMAIDADLGAGLIDEDEARQRRKDIKHEADFYGAMDGASKFVKGDAIAALLIIAVNIIGGFVVGYMRGQGDAMQILRTYAMLSVGEGLVAQIPALLISTSSGLLVTRAGQERPMAGTMFLQLLNQPRVLGSSGAALLVFGFIPGFPKMIFWGLGIGLIALSRFAARNPKAIADAAETDAERVKRLAKEQPKPVPLGPEAVLSLTQVDPLEIEIGYGLTRLADAKAGGDLPERVTSIRRQIALELGFVMPSVRIRDNAHLETNEYVLKIRGEEVARDSLHPADLLAITGGAELPPVPGAHTKEPVFGLEALWIEPGTREQAERSGYTVIEPSAVLATHLAEVVKTHAAELLTRQDVQRILDNVKGTDEQVVNELVPSPCSVGDVQKVFQHLLRERVGIRDTLTILETMADFAGKVEDPEQLGELVRAAIARTITRHFVEDGKLHCITLEPQLEQSLQEAMQRTAAGSIIAMEPAVQKAVVDRIELSHSNAAARGQQPVLLCSAGIRLPLRKLLDRYLPQVPVMAFNEVAAQADVEFVGQVAA